MDGYPSEFTVNAGPEMKDQEQSKGGKLKAGT